PRRGARPPRARGRCVLRRDRARLRRPRRGGARALPHSRRLAAARPRPGRGAGGDRVVSFVHELRVRYGECDPQGIVFNANYLLYFDGAFTEYWRDRVGPWDDMVSVGVDVVVAEANLRFRAPARLVDVLETDASTEGTR